MAGQGLFQGAGNTFASTFDLDAAESIALGGTIILVYTLLGGFWAVSVTDTLQGLLMIATAVLLPVAAVIHLGGPIAFYQALLRKYSDGILEFDPNMITVLPFRGDASGKRSKVRSTVKLDDGSTVSVDYELVKRKAGWLVFNVIIEGVSYVRNFRAELDSEIRASSLDAVIERLETEAGIADGE